MVVRLRATKQSDLVKDSIQDRDKNVFQFQKMLVGSTRIPQGRTLKAVYTHRELRNEQKKNLHLDNINIF